MVKQLEAIFDRIARAEQHLEGIKDELIAYYNSDPCTMSGKYQPDHQGGRGSGEWRIKVEPMSVRLNTLIGEFLHNLRSSLDHLAWQLVMHNKGEPTSQTTFPILRDAPPTNKKGQPTLPNVAGGLSRSARTLIDEAQPYKRGTSYADHSLWILHQLWNIDKHRHILAKGGWPEAHFRGPDIPEFTYTARFRSASENMADYVLVPDDPTVNVDANLTIQVALHEPEYGIERALLFTLKQIYKAVLTLVGDAEDRCF